MNRPQASPTLFVSLLQHLIDPKGDLADRIAKRLRGRKFTSKQAQDKRLFSIIYDACIVHYPI